MASPQKQSVAMTCFPEIAFGGFSRADGLIAFYSRVHALLEPGFTALDIGCGRGTQRDDPSPYRAGLRTLRGKCKQVIGIDVDPAAEGNDFIDEFRLIEDTSHWPVEDRSIDLALGDCVLEHIEDPASFFSEAARVIRPGGYLCLRTPNALGYVALTARIVPNALHRRVLRAVQPGRIAEDVFPTRYRCNRKGILRRMLAIHGFEPVVYRHEGQPGYLGFSRLAYRLGVVAGRFMPDVFKTTLLAFGRRMNAD